MLNYITLEVLRYIPATNFNILKQPMDKIKIYHLLLNLKYLNMNFNKLTGIQIFKLLSTVDSFF